MLDEVARATQTRRRWCRYSNRTSSWLLADSSHRPHLQVPVEDDSLPYSPDHRSVSAWPAIRRGTLTLGAVCSGMRNPVESGRVGFVGQVVQDLDDSAAGQVLLGHVAEVVRGSAQRLGLNVLLLGLGLCRGRGCR